MTGRRPGAALILAVLAMLAMLAMLWAPAAGAAGPAAPSAASRAADWAGSWEALKQAAGKVQSLAAGFTQERRLAILREPLVSRGRFLYQAPGSIRWEYAEPVKSLTLMHQGRARRFLWEDGAWKPEGGPGAQAMAMVLQEMNGWFKGEFGSGGTFLPELLTGPPRVVLTPANQEMTRFIREIVMHPASEPGVMREVEVVESPASRMSITFREVRVNAPLDRTLFEMP